MPPSEPSGPPGAVPVLRRPALLLIDLQYGDAHADSAYVQRRRAHDGDAAAAYYLGRIRDQVLPNVARLQAIFRAAGHPVVFVRIESLTADGRDRSPDHVRRGIHFPPGSPDGRILPDVAPAEDEIVISKTADNAFYGTGLGDLLVNLGVEDVVIAGVVSGSCVQATALAAAGRGAGRVWVAADGTAAWSDELQAVAEAAMVAGGAEVLPTASILAALPAAASGSLPRTARSASG